MKNKPVHCEIRTNPLHPWTGPITERGKAIAAMNSLKHGLTARRAVLPGESQADFEQLVDSLRLQHQPATELELQLCDEIGASLWRLQRVRAQEADTIHVNAGEIFNQDTGAGRGFDRLLRYLRAIENQFNRSIVRLQQLQAERRRLAERPAPQPDAQVAENGEVVSQGDFVSSTPPIASVPAPVSALFSRPSPLPRHRPDVPDAVVPLQEAC